MSLRTTTQSASTPARDETRVAANNATLLAANASLSAAGCATATVTSQAKTVNTFTYKVDGVFKSKAATDNFFTLNGPNVPAGSFQKWYLCIDAAGAAVVIPGTPSAVSAAAVGLPALPQGASVAGVLTIANVTNPFIPATTLLGAAGVTATYVDGIDPLHLALITIV